MRQVDGAALTEPHHEVTPGARVEGSVLLDGEDIYGAGIDPVGVRKTIGMVFQRPIRSPPCRFATTWWLA